MCINHKYIWKIYSSLDKDNITSIQIILLGSTSILFSSSRLKKQIIRERKKGEREREGLFLFYFSYFFCEYLILLYLGHIRLSIFKYGPIIISKPKTIWIRVSSITRSLPWKLPCLTRRNAPHRNIKNPREIIFRLNSLIVLRWN